MSYEDIPIEILNRFCKELQSLVSEDPNASLLEVLKSQIHQEFAETLDLAIEERIVPQIRNLEIQTACQISKNHEFYAELKKITDQLAVQISKLSDQINLLKSNSTQHLEKIELTIKQLNRKADIYELQALGKEVALMTPLTTFYQLQEWAQTLAGKTDIARLDRELRKTNEMIAECPTIDQMLNENAKIIVDMRSEISKEKLSLIAKISEVREMNTENDGKIEMTKNKIQQNNEILSKKINEVSEHIVSKPWTEETDELLLKINEKASSQEIVDLKNLVDPKLDDILVKFFEISEDLQEYTTVLARFDEVILTKASKEDFKVLKKMMNNTVLQNVLDPIITELVSKVAVLEETQKKQNLSLEEAKKEITSYAVLTVFQKTQAKDHAKLLDSMKTLTENIKSKADKSDIYSIFDIMGYREDFIDLSNSVHMFKDLFHQSVVLQQEAMNTFLHSGDSPVTKNRKRGEIVKNFEFIMRKLSSNPETTGKKPSFRSKKNLSSMASIHLDHFIDDKSATARATSTKNRRIVSAITKKRGSLI